MSTLFLIPARGGSKGLPGKNVALVGGFPLVGRAAHTALQALRARGGDGRVVCSTDDETIAAAAREWGAEVPFLRPAELASDSARSLDVVVHALRTLASARETTVVLLQATSPLTAVEDVLACMALHARGGGPVVSVTPELHPAAWSFGLGEAHALIAIDKTAAVSRRQDAQARVRLNGAIYVATAGWLLDGHGFVEEGTRGHVMPAERSIDIDSAQDLEVARALLASHAPQPFCIGDRQLGPGHPCFVIAEAGVNHNGSVALAITLAEAAKRAGADAVKYQTFKAERLATAAAPKATYQVGTTGAAESQLDMLRRLELSPEAHRQVRAACDRLGIRFLSSPFDEASADELDALGVEAFKIPSGEITNLPFLAHLARKGKPLILSTGMSSLREVADAVACMARVGSAPLALLQCVSNYPASPADANLRAMATMAHAFGVPVGYSDHCEGDAVTLAAVALGACIIEKHFTLDRALPGPDQQASLEPVEFAALVQRLRTVEVALGHGRKEPAASEANTAAVARKSLVASMALAKGHILAPGMVVARRPGTGIAPSRVEELLGRRLLCDVEEGQLLSVEMLA